MVDPYDHIQVFMPCGVDYREMSLLLQLNFFLFGAHIILTKSVVIYSIW
jgi:hypothetical protein